MAYGFPASRRIRESKDFDLAFRRKAVSNKWFSIHILDSVNDYPRLGMVVSKRTMPKSVNRNFAKRLIRELFRLNCSILRPSDFVVRIRRSVSKDSAKEARSALLELMLCTQ